MQGGCAGRALEKNTQKYAKMRKMQYFFKTTIFDLEEFQGSRWENKTKFKKKFGTFWPISRRQRVLASTYGQNDLK